MVSVTQNSQPASKNRTPKPSRRLERSIRLIQPATGNLPAVVRIRVGMSLTLYEVTELECHFPDCRAFHVEKQFSDRSSYHVCLAMNNPQDHTCECLGFLRWGHCRHIDGLIALLSHGQLNPPAGPAAAARKAA